MTYHSGVPDPKVNLKTYHMNGNVLHLDFCLLEFVGMPTTVEYIYIVLYLCHK